MGSNSYGCQWVSVFLWVTAGACYLSVFMVSALVRPVPGGRGGALSTRCDAEAYGLDECAWAGSVLQRTEGTPVEVERPS